jgi:peptidoglycan/xylan/chitin deacetylase (PgdA/CDA1 family)
MRKTNSSSKRCVANGTHSSWPDGKRTATGLSCDDARPSLVDAGVPVLDRHGLKATFYVVAENQEK